jgi:hypothetical protein
MKLGGEKAYFAAKEKYILRKLYNKCRPGYIYGVLTSIYIVLFSGNFSYYVAWVNIIAKIEVRKC